MKETTTTTLAKKKRGRNIVNLSKAVKQKTALNKGGVKPFLLPKPSLQTTPSSSKPYCIQRNPNLQNSPTLTTIQPKLIAPSPLTLTPAPALTPAAPMVAGTGTPDKKNTVASIQSLATVPQGAKLAPCAVNNGQTGTEAPGPQDHPAVGAAGPGWVTATPNTANKIFLSKDGKIIRPQVSNSGTAQPSRVQPGTKQKVQIVKNANGKIEVCGLLPGQQLVKMPDGNLQMFSWQSSFPVKPVAGARVLGIGPNSLHQQKGTPVMLSPLVTQQPFLLPKLSLQTTLKVPAGSKAATPAKQNTVGGIQSLGTNTLTIKDSQLIMQGPNYAATTQRAKLLSSGAKLANPNSKQVLLTTLPAKEQPAEVEAARTNTL